MRARYAQARNCLVSPMLQPSHLTSVTVKKGPLLGHRLHKSNGTDIKFVLKRALMFLEIWITSTDFN